MIGEKSLIKNFIIPNTRNKQKSYEVLVQANKNYGICDIIIPNDLVAPEPPADKSSKPEKAAYKAAKLIYDTKMRKAKQLRSDLLNAFQGRQINDSFIRTHLSNVLYSVLNYEE